MKRKTLVTLAVGVILTILGAGTCVAVYYLFIAVVRGNAVTKEELTGTWTADYRDPPDTIVLKNNSTYVHTYSIPDGRRIVDTDNWELCTPSKDPQIVLHNFSLFRPDRESYSCDDILRAPVEPWLNKHRIVIDSEVNYYFEK